MTWKFTDQTNRVVSRTNSDGSVDSRLASAIDPKELAAALPADPPPAPRAKPKDDPALTPVAGAAPVTRAEFESLKALLGKELP